VFGCDEYKCFGPYTADFCEKTPGGGALHHPGRLMHKLRGENLAYFYLSILIEAVEDVCRLLGCERSAETLAAAAPHVGGDEANLGTSGSSASVSNISGPAVDNGAAASAPEVPQTVRYIRRLSQHQQTQTDRYISSALNLTRDHASPLVGQPRATSRDIHKVITGYLRQVQEASLPPVPAAYNISELSSERPQCYTNFEPRVQNALSEIVVPQYSNWKSELSFLDAAAVLKSATKGYGYIDRKYIYTSVGINSTLVVTVKVSRPSAVWLCEVQKGFAKYPSTVADLIEGAEVYADLHSHSSTALKGAAGNNVTYSPPNLAGMRRIGKFLFNTVALAAAFRNLPVNGRAQLFSAGCALPYQPVHFCFAVVPCAATFKHLVTCVTCTCAIQNCSRSTSNATALTLCPPGHTPWCWCRRRINWYATATVSTASIL
jgi:hypothetical protein